ncbi:hypothetical protein [Mucilaginibacter antarcticus]|uniref:Uncharacterized protein n=1 Tax=Mucilaginibacter antarcticus TaxID=1855725 RepID=A0ABW5XSE3_9SPHI
MKPNAEQLQDIEDILSSVTQYRETYDELYDHILSAMDRMPDNAPFIPSLRDIMENELGGKRGVSRIERKYCKSALKEVIKKYCAYFGQYLISPYVVILIGLTYGFYLGMTSGVFHPRLLMMGWLFINILMAIVRKRLIVKARNNGTYGKSSIISILYVYLAMFPIILTVIVSIGFMISLAFVDLAPFTWYPSALVLIFFLYMVNILVYYQFLKDEFKTITTS